MKVIWNVTKKNVETFDVVAETLESVQQKLSGRGEFGEFRPMPISASLNRDGSVTLAIGHTILMPVWKGYTKAQPQCQKEWDRMWRQLEKHEQLHLGLYLSGASKLYDEIASRPEGSLTNKQLGELAREIGSEIDRNSRDLDHRTRHGTTEGVKLDPPFGCRAMDFK